MKIGIVVPILNNFQQALDFITSVKSQEHEIKFYIQPQWRDRVCVSQAWNRGIQSAIDDGCKYVMVSNDDVLLAPHSIDRAVQSFEDANENQVLLTFQEVNSTFSNFLDILNSGPDTEFTADPIIPMPVEHRYLFSCFLVRNDFFEKCGTFDENFIPTWWEDVDMQYRIHLLGYDLCKTDVPIIHYGSVTTYQLPEGNPNTVISEIYYKQKWGSSTRLLKELYSTPYDNKELTPREWIK